jgi:hypothetical protein
MDPAREAPVGVIGVVPPGLLLAVPLTLLLAQLLHAFWHTGRCRYRAVLLLTVAGVALGQLWDVAGLPAVRLGQLNLLPAILFAIGLQPFGRRLSLRLP